MLFFGSAPPSNMISAKKTNCTNTTAHKQLSFCVFSAAHCGASLAAAAGKSGPYQELVV
jgi:hypothetical protein